MDGWSFNNLFTVVVISSRVEPLETELHMKACRPFSYSSLESGCRPTRLYQSEVPSTMHHTEPTAMSLSHSAVFQRFTKIRP